MPSFSVFQKICFKLSSRIICHYLLKSNKNSTVPEDDVGMCDECWAKKKVKIYVLDNASWTRELPKFTFPAAFLPHNQKKCWTSVSFLSNKVIAFTHESVSLKRKGKFFSIPNRKPQNFITVKILLVIINAEIQVIDKTIRNVLLEHLSLLQVPLKKCASVSCLVT